MSFKISYSFKHFTSSLRFTIIRSCNMVIYPSIKFVLDADLVLVFCFVGAIPVDFSALCNPILLWYVCKSVLCMYLLPIAWDCFFNCLCCIKYIVWDFWTVSFGLIIQDLSIHDVDRFGFSFSFDISAIYLDKLLQMSFVLGLSILPFSIFIRSYVFSVINLICLTFRILFMVLIIMINC